MVCETTVNDANSQESISMLHECYEEQGCWKNQFPELVETCLNSTLEMIDVNDDDEMGEGWMVKEVPPDERKECVPDKDEKSTQTNFSIFSENKMAAGKDQEARNHANFIGSIMKFKAILSSRKEVSKKKVWNVLKSISSPHSNSSSSTPPSGDESRRSDLDNGRQEETVHPETIGYLLRTTNTDKVFLDTVKALLTYLEGALDKDLERVACCWKNSVHEMAVEMINQGLETESGIRKMVDSFLFRTVSSILRNEGELKNLALESKAMFVMNFCRSTYLCYDVINYVINKLTEAFRDCRGRSNLEERLNWTRLTNNSYFLFRILETLLASFKTKLENEEVEETAVQETERKNVHVLAMWKKHWHQGKGCQGSRQGKTQNSFKVTANKWCDELDCISLQCVKHIPICSLPCERCGKLAKDILMMCRQGATGIQKGKNLTGVCQS